MTRVVALLAAVAFVSVTIGACGGGGAEPGASQEATLVLDFQPNAVHAGIYTALVADEFSERGVELEVREPSSSSDAPKLLSAGRAEFAVLDIHDLALARERGIDVVGVAAIVQRPLAAVIARDSAAVRSPRDLEGGEVGVTGLPSDDAVLESVLEAGGADVAAVDRVTIGFDSIAALSAGRLDAATAFWNAEGVILRELGVPTREFRVDDFGAPDYPELVLATSKETIETEPELVDAVVAALGEGSREAVADPERALSALIASAPALERAEQRAQLDALIAAGALSGDVSLDQTVLRRWAAWDLERGIVSRPIDVDAGFSQATSKTRN
jgi:ABC-type nitrate/sulfonate/bicarbonate transport system substrate-binding protein